MTEAELLANLPADGVRVFRGNPGVLRCSNSMYTWMSSESGWKEAHYVSPEFYATDARWTEITPTPTPAPSLREQRIAEAWERWPDGRLFEDTSESNQLELRMCVNGVARFTARHKQEWHAEENDPTYVYESANHWHEIPRPAVVPTLPDPSGDLPDGTRVRVTITYEAAVRDWTGQDKYGEYVLDNGDVRANTSWPGNTTTVEVLSLPTPTLAALQGEPGTLWRDPETGSVYTTRRIKGDEVDSMVKLIGREDQLDFLYAGEDDARIATFIPTEVTDHG